jgi:hypothetical protein
MAWERIADKKIRDAMAEGRFDGVSRPGPVDLEDYFKLPVELRMAYSVLKSAGCLPEEVELLREVDRLEQAISEERDHEKQAGLRTSLTAVRLKLDVALERARKR